MPVHIYDFQLGPLQNNSYLVADPESSQAILIDAPAGAERMAEFALQQKWQITGVYLTHAHFDHILGTAKLLEYNSSLPVALHHLDFPLWRSRGGAPIFGLFAEQQPDPTCELLDNQMIQIGNSEMKVLHTPGHTPGHVAFSLPDEGVVFTGDLIFFHSVGRTDLPGGDANQLLTSIHKSILTLPKDTRLLSGHGQATTVKEEFHFNPFLI